VKRRLAFTIILGAIALGLPAGARAQAPVDANSSLNVEPAQLLERSQVSYRAEGGFTGVESYGVVISCVRGEVSVMASIHDPRVPGAEPMRTFSHMSSERYLALWNSLIRQAALRLENGPALNRDVRDEFTVSFHLSVGEQSRDLHAQGLSLPECSRYQALRSLIDDAADMASLWKAHDDVAGLSHGDDHHVTFETLESDLVLDQ
jgi:hypothetical protein